MGVEGGDLIYFGHGHAHFIGQRHEMVGRQAAIFVLDQMKMLDQLISGARRVAEKYLNIFQRAGIRLTALGLSAGLAAAPRMRVSFYALIVRHVLSTLPLCVVCLIPWEGTWYFVYHRHAVARTLQRSPPVVAVQNRLLT